LNADGSFSYTPSADYNGPDSFTYRANDGEADSAPPPCRSPSGRNDAPVAGDDSYSTDEDTALTIARPACSATTPTSRRRAARGPGQRSGARHADLNADGSFSYTPSADYNGPTASAIARTTASRLERRHRGDHRQGRQRRAGRGDDSYSTTKTRR
jgi:hypothetical protein